ncbi:MAG: RAMP superfamily CRISPR-associated protein [Pseudomonadota bacterium]|nr:RAMP superfamily CRISPR-associated protein [Pseudomonadota bacterium]MDP1906631.1 RAMP superfamily CRISPR-associated protein [Pseudomonadota bacterium]MDP2354050.1 RAMP superfamily CRISPR-associated protein [Pseudomonadota bacterium]
MNPFASYRMLITPLSPIHVGTGESYEPTNYVIEDGVLHEFDTGAVMAALSAADRKVLEEIGNRRPDTGMIEALQRFFYERREALMGHAIQRIPVLPGVAGFYEKRVKQTANREADGKKVVNRLEIDRTSFNPVTRLPVLFGSSLKGAMRTALLDGVNGGRPAQERKGLHEFQGRLFRYFDENARPHLSLELDPMRLVQLSDAAWSGEPGLPAAQVHLAVNRKKVEVKDQQGSVRKSQAEAKELYQILECTPGWRYRAFSGQINLQLVDGVAEKDRSGNRQIPVANLRFDAAQVARACNDFYRPILEEECRLLHQRGFLDATWYKAIQQFLATTQTKLKRGDAFLLRVGRHSGAESVTLNGVRNIKIMKGKDEKPEYLEAAKTLWLAGDEKDQSTNLLPFGWLLVELQPLDGSATDWPELEAACRPHLSTARAFKDKLAGQQVRLEQAKADAEARRREEEEKARQATEEEAQRRREDEEHQARLSALTPNLRRIEEFKADFTTRVEQLRGGKDRQNTDYHQRAQKLAKDALDGADWTTEEKCAAADAIAKWLPLVVERIDKEALKKLKLGTLRGNP